MKVKDIKAMIAGKSDDEEIFGIINRNDYIAVKLWSREDVAEILEEEGYAPTETNVDAVLALGELSYLGDCVDEEWNVIRNAIKHVAEFGELEEE